MSKTRRIVNIITGLVMIIFGLLAAASFGEALHTIITLLGIILIISGVRYLVYFFSMSRHMVGGKVMLFQGIIILDLGIFTISLTNAQLAFIVFYLVFIHLFSGVIDILRSLEARRLEAKSWKLNLSTGIINILIALAALIFGVFMQSVTLMVLIYGAGLVYDGALRIISAFRRTAIVYIQ